ncbi:MAG: hypothetical protein L3J72_04235, partial [Thermoplasmata archaeon]|nr:hypothetical protein [Thermoplasmata archaeon]
MEQRVLTGVGPVATIGVSPPPASAVAPSVLSGGLLRHALGLGASLVDLSGQEDPRPAELSVGRVARSLPVPVVVCRLDPFLVPGASVEKAPEAIEGTLRRLGRHRIDVLALDLEQALSMDRAGSLRRLRNELLGERVGT